MNEREIVCYKCERSVIATTDDFTSGWVIGEPGWAMVNYAFLCPKCNAKHVRNTKIINERAREYARSMKGDTHD